jgi:hypothetical protein
MPPIMKNCTPRNPRDSTIIVWIHLSVCLSHPAGGVHHIIPAIFFLLDARTNEQAHGKLIYEAGLFQLEDITIIPPRKEWWQSVLESWLMTPDLE